MTGDQFALHRFLDAQEPIIDTVLRELAAGRKTSHWMWFIFPQLRGLGSSPIAQYYGLGSLDEAQAYLDHPVLGARLKICTQTTLKHSSLTLRQIFGTPDNMKFFSSMSVFALASDTTSVFQHALDQWCDGKIDEATIKLLSAS